MISYARYQKSFIAALFLHLGLFVFLLVNPETSNPVLISEPQNETGMLEEKAIEKAPEIIHASSVDNEALTKTLEHLKSEREAQKKREVMHQQALKKEAEAAQILRAKEEAHLKQLKNEALKLEEASKKAMEAEKKRLKALNEEKEREEKRLQALKQEQKMLAKKQEEAKNALKEQALKEQKEKEAKLQKEKEEKERGQKLADEAMRRERMAGEIDRYKAMIIRAISQQWILPEHANQHLSSRFRIRLAPDGKVLEVTLISSSGDAVLDRSAQTAIYKASPLPIPSDPNLFNIFREISLTVRPENIRG